MSDDSDQACRATVSGPAAGAADPDSPNPVPGSEELLRLVCESATGYAIFTTDQDGLVTSWNTGAQRLLGYAEGEIIGRSADVLLPAEEGGPHAAEERALALRDGRAEDERWHMRKDGTQFWASGLLMPLAEAGPGFVTILRDRTDSRLAEARLRESEERFRLLAANIPQLVFRSNPDGIHTWGGPQWIEFTGLELSESVGLGWLDAIHPDDREATMAAWSRAQDEGDYYVEHRVRRAVSGEYRWHQTRARPMQREAVGDGHDWVGTMTDIHDLRGLHERQQVLLAELQHRTRNLLAVTQAVASQTIRGSNSLGEFRTKFENRLCALSRVQALLARTDHDEIDLRELVTVELAAHGGGDPGRAHIDGPPVTLPPAAAQALGLALHELSTNAVKYGALSQPQGRIAVTWQVGARDSQPEVELVWSESGVVVPQTDIVPRKGYGSDLIERALPYQLGARTSLEIGAGGVRCRIAVVLDTSRVAGLNG